MNTVLNITDDSSFLTINEQPVILQLSEDNLELIEHNVQETLFVLEDPDIIFISVAEQGPAGIDGDLHYIHNQILASNTWIVNHNLGKRPSVTIVDSGDNIVTGDVEYINDDSLKVRFSADFGGRAYIN